ncbi:MAG: deoxyribose-phosphate aldolase, partial [Bacteroidales bacterium]|nr:deoxyribose-phosphate aldolase [Bacteroidales bacterium]
DVVLNVGYFRDGAWEELCDEIYELKQAVGERPLKVILETGLLGAPERIARASFLAMEAGADFIKTSTGKVEVNATPTAAYIMCECIRAYYEKTGVRVGFKAAGGISTAQDAVLYYAIGAAVLGAEWIEKDHFRFGVSRLGNSLMSAIEGKTVNFF